jgi:hypothetical protein
MKSLSTKFEALTDKQKEQVLKIFASCENKTNKQIEIERLKAEKLVIKANYTGLFNILNTIQKETTMLSVKGLKKTNEKIGIIGTMDVNNFLGRLNNPLRYTFDNVWNFAKNYENANDGDKVIISERGEKINTLLTSLNSGEISALESLENFIDIVGAPFKLNAKGERKCTLTQGSVKNIFANFPTLYRKFGLSEYFPTLHTELTTISEEISEAELIPTL